MIAGQVISFAKNEDENPEFSDDALIEVTDWGNEPFIELAVSVGKRRVYIKFRMFDLEREIQELKESNHA